MANTEGLSDEALGTLFSTSPQQHQAEARDSQMLANSRKMQQRLDMPMGTKPAAKVVRRSATPSVAGTTKTKPAIRSEAQSKASSKVSGAAKPFASNSKDQPSSATSELVLGSIVERPRTRRSRKARKQQQNSNKHSNDSFTNDKTGFPSVHVPLGTFVKPPAESATAVNNTKKEEREGLVGHQQHDQLRRETAQEADALLAKMSLAEIQDSKREIEQSLSPELLSFLRQRKAKTNKHPLPLKPVAPAPLKKEEKQDDDQPEHEARESYYQRLADIKTHEDMDAAYKAEHGDATGPFFLPKNDGGSAAHGGSDTEERFAVACDLLRSSVPRQTLWAAQTVHERLEHDWRKGQRPALHYPVTLIVSLRCLLDAPALSNGHVLHAHVLQAMYWLVRHYVHPDHDVTLVNDETSEKNRDDDRRVFQQWFANDAVPSTPLDVCYNASAAVRPLSVKGVDQQAAYATTSSSESATRDGQAFARDPLWTLLSPMRLIPRLAQLLPATGGGGDNHKPDQLPQEGVVAICGILGMMAHRSPGAAAAMAQHPTLTHSLLMLALGYGDADTEPLDSALAFPIVYFFSILARQSQVAAQALQEPHVEELLTRYLSFTDKKMVVLQRWTLILWRTLLRYGCATHLMETVLTVTASQRGRLAWTWPCHAELCSCLATLLKSNASQLQQSPQQIRYTLASVVKTSIVCLGDEQSTTEAIMDARQVLNLATSLDFLQALDSRSAMAQPSSPEADSPADQGSIFTAEETTSIQSSLAALVQSGFLSKALKHCASAFFASDTWRSAGEVDAQLEAALSSFVTTYLQQVLPSESHWIAQGHAGKVIVLLADACLVEAKQRTPASSLQATPSRTCWRNCCHTSMLVALLSLSDPPIHPTVLSAMLVVLLGRLQTGEESLGLQLLEKSVLHFRAHGNHDMMQLSAMLLTNLQSTAASSFQLKHSFRLRLPLASPEQPASGPSELPSLGSTLSGPSTKSSDLLFPIGRFWLWKVLAGGTPGSATTNASADEGKKISGELLQIAHAACRVIERLEHAATMDGSCLYGHNVNTGGKLYYVMNLCLQDESLLEQTDILDMADTLVIRYAVCMDQLAAATLLRECTLHSAGQQQAGQQDDDDTPLTADEETVKAWLTSQSNKDTLKSLMTFLSDLCTAFTEYGAQYPHPLFARCMRTFLLPAFPSGIRCEVLRKLSGLLHLFTIEEEDESLCEAVAVSLESTESVSGSREWLDGLAEVFVKGSAGGLRADLKFIRVLAACSLALDLQIKHDKMDQRSRTRLESAEESFALTCMNLAIFIARNKAPTRAIIDFAMRLVSVTERTRESGWEATQLSEAWEMFASAEAA